MSTQQPDWKCVANLGDVHPIDHGGYFVYEDQTGVYAPECELLTPLGDDDSAGWNVHRFILETCTYQDGVLSDNKYHPALPAWFAKPESERATRPQDTTYLSNLAKFVGMETDAFAAMFLSGDISERAEAWRIVGEYHGFENLDSYPLTFKPESKEDGDIARCRAEVETRYAADLATLKSGVSHD